MDVHPPTSFPLAVSAHNPPKAMVLYAMLAGKPPFDGASGEELKNVNGEKPFVDPAWHRGYMEVGKNVFWGPSMGQDRRNFSPQRDSTTCSVQ